MCGGGEGGGRRDKVGEGTRWAGTEGQGRGTAKLWTLIE